jgi:hypothetical protein
VAKPTPVNYTRFVHVHKEGVGMAAQDDGLPQHGDNPTFAWTPGEVVRDEVALTIAADAAPGDYSLRIGFYDPQSGARMAARDAGGQALPDDEISLTGLTVR